MLDLFGKVFGQNKSTATSNTVPNTSNSNTNNRSEARMESGHDELIMVNGTDQQQQQQATTSATHSTMYAHLQLKNEMLVSASQSSNQIASTNAQQQQQQPAHTSSGHFHRVHSWTTAPIDIVPFDLGTGLESSSSPMEEPQFLLTQEAFNRVSHSSLSWSSSYSSLNSLDDDELSISSVDDEIITQDVITHDTLTLEGLRTLYNSCLSCGVSWHEDHVSLDCAECGGYAMSRPCPQCDGKCQSLWRRNVNKTHDCHKAIWEGECLWSTATPTATCNGTAVAVTTKLTHNENGNLSIEALQKSLNHNKFTAPRCDSALVSC